MLLRFLEYARRLFASGPSLLTEVVLPRVQMSVLGLWYPGLLFEKGFWLAYRRALLPFWLRSKLRGVLRLLIP